MISPKRMGFVLALISAISVTVICVSNFEQNSATASGVKIVKVLRRIDKKQDKPTAAEAASAQETTEERKFEDDIPKHVPIRFKLKAEKEKKFKDLNNPDWYRDFELEVTNTSDKPIYFLDLWLVYPEIISASGAPVGVELRYGKLKFIEQQTRPIAGDVPIKPGETYTFVIPDQDRKGWEAHKQRDNTPDPRKTLLTFVHLSFGDGTGFATSGAKPYPFQREQSSAPFCRSGPQELVGMSGPVDIAYSMLERTTKPRFNLTVRATGGHFSIVKGSYVFLKDFATSRCMLRVGLLFHEAKYG